MNQPQGFKLTNGEVTDVEPLKVIFNPAVPYEVPHMILAAYLVTGFLVASVYAVGMLRGRRDRYHRLGLLIPLTVACIVTPIQFAVGDTAARAIAEDQPIKFAAMECVQTTSHARHRVHLRPLHAGRRQGRARDPRLRLLPGRLEHRHGGDRARHRAARGPATRQHDAALGLRHDGRHLHDADRARGVVRLRLVATARHPAHEMVPARGRGLRRVLGRGARVRLDRHRGRPAAVDRLQRDAHEGRRDAGRRDLGDVHHRRGALRRARCRAGDHAAGDGAALARTADEEDSEVPYGPSPPVPPTVVPEAPQ